MKRIVFFALTALMVLMGEAKSVQPALSKEKMDKYITELMGKMTLEEKIGQLNLIDGGDTNTGTAQNSNSGKEVAKGRAGALLNVKGVDKIREMQRIAVEDSRMGIPLLMGLDVIHGFRTVFPIPLGMASSWDMEAIERAARIAAVEASASGINWTFSPMVDIARDPRWGRMAEGAGEDPVLGSAVARALVRGYQGDLKDSTNILACIKHFALYGGAEAGRDYNTVDMSRGRMYNEYLAPYKAAVEEGAATLMTSFNLVDGIPATANKWLLDDLLRGQWGFDGMIVTDYGSIHEMRSHGVAELPEASVLALKAGTDMDMCSSGFVNTLKESVEKGLVSEAEIDRACRRILEAKYKLGLFDNPYRFTDSSRAKKDVYTKGHRAEARRIAAETFVLLKNEGDVLPLSKKGKIALIGPLGDAANNMEGCWSVGGDASLYKSLRKGLEDAVGNKATVLYAKGTNVYEDAVTEKGASFYRPMRDERTNDELLEEAKRVASESDVIIAAVGELSEESGESSSRTSLTLPENQRKLLRELLATGKPVIMLNFSGRSTILDWESENIPVIMNVWFAGSEAGDAIADVVFGDVNPSGKLTVTMPRNVGQIPIYYNHMNTGRPKKPGDAPFKKYVSNYIDSPNTPLYPFGFGKSYTTYDYTDFKLDKNVIDPNGSITASVTVTNTGKRAGSEVVQFYIHDILASVARPVKELKHFERIDLKPGESKKVSFKITPETLKFYNYNLDYVAEPGDFTVMVGPDSENLQSLSFTLK